MRKIALLGLAVSLFLLASCGPTEEELIESEKTKIFISLGYPKEISEGDEFDVKISISNELKFPITLSSMGFPFLDFKFSSDAGCGEGSVRVENDCYAAENSIDSLSVDIGPMETRVFEFDITGDNLFGGGIISSMMKFDLRVNDPKGSRDFSKGEDIIVEVKWQ